MSVIAYSVSFASWGCTTILSTETPPVLFDIRNKAFIVGMTGTITTITLEKLMKHWSISTQPRNTSNARVARSIVSERCR